MNIKKLISTATRFIPRVARIAARLDKKIHIHIAAPVVLSAALIAVWALFIRGHTIAVLSPQGIIAHQQRSLLITATLLMLIVVVPVFVLTAVIAWRYREGNKKAKYTPDWDHHNELEFIWWALPCLIILALGMLAWRSSHDLDPYRAISSNKTPINVQVVALQWKWLFIYPDQHIATMNYLEFPEGTPVNMQITADAPMNSFWIPRLGGQVYAMAGMSTKLHLMSDHAGSYRGVSANMSGDGFAGMKFTANAVSQRDFDRWVLDAQGSAKNLGMVQYEALAKQSTNNPVASYALLDETLYDKILMKYMGPPGAGQHTHQDGE